MWCHGTPAENYWSIMSCPFWEVFPHRAGLTFVMETGCVGGHWWNHINFNQIFVRNHQHISFPEMCYCVLNKYWNKHFLSTPFGLYRNIQCLDYGMSRSNQHIETIFWNIFLLGENSQIGMKLYFQNRGTFPQMEIPFFIQLSFLHGWLTQQIMTWSDSQENTQLESWP